MGDLHLNNFLKELIEKLSILTPRCDIGSDNAARQKILQINFMPIKIKNMYNGLTFHSVKFFVRVGCAFSAVLRRAAAASDQFWNDDSTSQHRRMA